MLLLYCPNTSTSGFLVFLILVDSVAIIHAVTRSYAQLRAAQYVLS